MTTAAAHSEVSAPLPAPKVIGVAAIIAALSLFWIASENHYAQCISGDQPAASSAGAGHGAAQQRQAPAGGCKRYLVI